ncbi:MAG: type II secretion system protein [Desulfobacterium sp.]
MNGNPLPGAQSQPFSHRGFTYPAALLLIVITSISLMGVQKYWSTTMQREREKTLLFNGLQIQNAIASYYRHGPGGKPSFPHSLKVLINDARSGRVRRHLRRLYADPMTPDGQWGQVLDGQGGIKGVFSRSNGKPLKQDNFPAAFSHFRNKKKYSDWKFVFEPGKGG